MKYRTQSVVIALTMFATLKFPMGWPRRSSKNALMPLKSLA